MEEFTVSSPVAGRPGEIREPKENRTYDFLDGLGVSYLRVDHPPADTIEICGRVEEVLKAPVAKNLFLCDRQKTRFFLLLMPGNKPFKTKYLTGQFEGPRLSFGDPELLDRMLDLTPGSVSPFGLLADPEKKVKLLIDREVVEPDAVCFHPCRNTSTLRLNSADFRDRVLPALDHSVTWVSLPWAEETAG